jgi:CheY-like chemotaxis protein
MFAGHERMEVVKVTARIGLLEARHRVLLLDGDSEERAALRGALAARSCDVVTAGDATNGVRLLLEELLELDVLVIDLHLPHRDARSLAQLVRRDGGEQELAIVVLAADLAPERRAELRALGVDAIVDRRDGAAAAAEVVLRTVAERRSAAAGTEFSFASLPDLPA